MRCRAAAFCKTCELQAQSFNGRGATPLVLFKILFLFPFPHLLFQSHISRPYFNSRSREAFFKPQRRPAAASFFYFALRLRSQPPALLRSLFLLCLSGFLCVRNFVTQSPLSFVQNYRGPPEPRQTDRVPGWAKALNAHHVCPPTEKDSWQYRVVLTWAQQLSGIHHPIPGP